MSDGKALVGRGEEEKEGRGRDRRGMDMGELMLNFLGGKGGGLLLSEELKRLLFSFASSLERFIQETFSGITFRPPGGAGRGLVKRGGGGRTGGREQKLVNCWLLSALPVRLGSQVRWSESSPPPLEGLTSLASSTRGWCGPLLELIWPPPSGLMKRGLVKHSAPLGSQQSSWEGLRRGRRGPEGDNGQERGL